MPATRSAWLVLALALPAIGQAADVVVYRCTGSDGRLTLRDTPCRPGERQQVRSMLRPVDPPPPRHVQAAPAPAVAPAERPRVVVRTPSRPLYECVTADGGRYTSGSEEGNPRWVPLWTLGVVSPGWSTYGPPPAVEGRIRGGIGRSGRYDLRVGDGRHRPPRSVPVAPYYAGGTWLRDACSPLPPQEACARLRDRRYELDRRYNSALQSERAVITAEQRGIDAQLANDCGEG